MRSEFEKAFNVWRNSLLNTEQGQKTLRGKSMQEEIDLFKRVCGDGENYYIQ